MAGQHQEHAFETTIESSLLANGWMKGEAPNYRVDLGLDTWELLNFITASQPDAWTRLADYQGGDAAAQSAFNKRVSGEIDSRGTLDVLRKGVEVSLIHFDLAYWRPAHRLTPELWDLYRLNRLTVSRQVHHSEKRPHDSVDLLMLLNGVPVATAELKNQVTGQNVMHARHQYETDRDPHDLLFRARAMVHFAVDQDFVYMTTRLARQDTFWLPFNQGSNGPGRPGGAGNPVNPNGYKTAYLWEKVWERENWLEMLGSFLSEDTGGKPVTRIKGHERRWLFPRYHQWDAVRSIAADAKAYGPGKNYLAMHSTGSGKSNTIAWLASTLATLHTPADTDGLGLGAKAAGLGPNEPVFNKVIIVTDRVVLDRQLQDTVTGFAHTPGTIQKIDENSAQLREALASAKARIIITTLFKFPIVAQAAAELAGTRFAVIADEAHSSQTGEAAKDLKAVLSGLSGEKALEAAEKEDEAEERAADAASDLSDLLAKSMQARGKQSNLSFFAFTATPKQKTLELFGDRIPDPDRPGETRLVPFHLYSMRQAIDEQFILDTLANYLPYSLYYRLANGLRSDDPELPKGKAASALARFVSLHPAAFAQKAEVIVEHFRVNTAAKIGGHAKAMVVTRSRLHAVRMKEAIDAYVRSKGYKDVAALVAFSGTVIDPDNPIDPDDPSKGITEPMMNGFGEAQLPKRFKTDDYQVLVVAEKYQTGFDEPLLHTMYVDKKLDGVKAVQTLSRLNRTMPGKVDTFVLDFVNKPEDITAAFAPFYDRSWAPPTDPNLLSDLRTRLYNHNILDPEEMDALVTALLQQTAQTNEALYVHTDRCVHRWHGLDEDDREDFRTALRDYVRLYGFLAHVLPVSASDMERLYLYGRILLTRLRDEDEPPGPELAGLANLTHLRLEAGQVTAATPGTISDEDAKQNPKLDSKGKQHEDPMERLSEILKGLNERYGINVTDEDQLFIEQVEAEVSKDRHAQAFARNNDYDQFMAVFPGIVEKTFLSRHTANDSLVAAFLDKPEFREAIVKYIGESFYNTVRSSGEGA